MEDGGSCIETGDPGEGIISSRASRNYVSHELLVTVHRWNAPHCIYFEPELLLDSFLLPLSNGAKMESQLLCAIWTSCHPCAPGSLCLISVEK